MKRKISKILKAIFLILTMSKFNNASCDMYIISPENGSTVTGAGLLFTGTSTQKNEIYNLSLNGVTISRASTDGDGNWNFTYPSILGNGYYTNQMEILNNDFSILDSASNNFTVINSPTIAITSPAEGETIEAGLYKIYGTASIAGAGAAIFVDNIFSQTATVDINGNWQAEYPQLPNAAHTLLTQLISGGSIVASCLTTFTSIITTNFGNTLRVDQVFGNDSTGQRNGSPYKTINAALAAALPGDDVWVFPGTYEETIIIPERVSLIGLDSKNVVISKIATTNTTLLTMGEYSNLENFKLNLTALDHYTLCGINFPGTTSKTARMRGVSLTVDNSSASAIGTSNVYGILANGTGEPDNTENSIKTCSIDIHSAGLGAKRGIILNSQCKLICRNTDICVSNSGGAGSYIGAETTSDGARLNLLSSSLSGTTADISQTAGEIIIESATLTNMNANALGFTSIPSPSKIIWADIGTLPAGTNYMRPGTAAPATAANEPFVMVAQPTIVKALYVRAHDAPGGAITDTWTLRKNAINTSLSVSLIGTNTSALRNDVSVSFNTGDSISLQVVKGVGSVTADEVVVMDLY